MVLPVVSGSSGLLSLVKYRRTWERMGSGGLRGPQNRCEACKTSWMCSIHIRSRHTLPALLCSRSCCVPQRRCFVFARAFRSAAISVAVFSFVHRVSSMPMEVFCRMTTVRRADLSCVVQAGGCPRAWAVIRLAWRFAASRSSNACWVAGASCRRVGRDDFASQRACLP